MFRLEALAVFLLGVLPGAPALAQVLVVPETIIPQKMAADGEDGTVSGKFWSGMFSPGDSAKVMLGLLYDQATFAVPEWGSGAAGLGRRAEWVTAGYLTRYTTEFATAELLGTDTSYRRCLCKGFRRRAGHALHAEFVERKRDGSDTFAFARLSGIYVSAAATAPMLPAGDGAWNASNRAMASLAIDEGFNMLKEFWPEIRRTLLPRGFPARR